jgi:ankyrin repeat protein
LAIISDQVGIVDQLLTTEATSGDRRYAGDTALMLAAGGGNVEILEKIIRLNPDIDAIDAAGNTALMWAVIAGRQSTASVLLAHGADRAMRNRNRDRAMDIAQRSGDVELIRVLKNVGLAARWF